MGDPVEVEEHEKYFCPPDSRLLPPAFQLSEAFGLSTLGTTVPNSAPTEATQAVSTSKDEPTTHVDWLVTLGHDANSEADETQEERAAAPLIDLSSGSGIKVKESRAAGKGSASKRVIQISDDEKEPRSRDARAHRKKTHSERDSDLAGSRHHRRRATRHSRQDSESSASEPFREVALERERDWSDDHDRRTRSRLERHHSKKSRSRRHHSPESGEIDSGDEEGYDDRDYSRKGYDRKGYDRKGYDRDGRDRAGFDRNGYDSEGYDRRGYDKRGFNEKGFDRGGFDKYGYDKHGYDRSGYDEHGYNKGGFDREGYNREGYNEKGYDRRGFDEDGFNRKGFDCRNIHVSAYRAFWDSQQAAVQPNRVSDRASDRVSDRMSDRASDLPIRPPRELMYAPPPQDMPPRDVPPRDMPHMPPKVADRTPTHPNYGPPRFNGPPPPPMTQLPATGDGTALFRLRSEKQATVAQYEQRREDEQRIDPDIIRRRQLINAVDLPRTMQINKPFTRKKKR
eukprot:Blabericola_migrator_1__1670@NODE_144_length_13005_cov_119_784279_g125_i0_p3_GENE_NODE_144_length_13005_cov_119_784279_g125_i0NODE_144_length_13005_cov_119_784279_g125_i0_p3_ORF_typecomplete_len510_score66_20Lamprin/PF06403_11/66_NODE_144_length_13005_cov_119_784279_g125_i0868810217